MIEFVDVYSEPKALEILYQLLAERDPIANISHHTMPTFEEHRRFVAKKPYFIWDLIKAEDIYVGSIYLTRTKEIGISIFKEHQDKGYGSEAVELLMAVFGGDFYANVSPRNLPSQHFFTKLGGELIQYTYKLTRGDE